MKDQRFCRTELLLGKRASEALRACRVCVIGLGGVGSYAVEAWPGLGSGVLS